jgi:TolA-binding protein
VDAVNEAIPQIDIQFGAEPAVAGHLHQTIAKTLDSRVDFPQARREYARAADLFIKSEGQQSQDAILTLLKAVDMEARSHEPGYVERAKSLLERSEALASKIAHPSKELAVYLLAGRGAFDVAQNDNRSAGQQFSAALQLAQAAPSLDERTCLRLKQRLAFSLFHIDGWSQAEALLRSLTNEYSKLDGPGSPNVLQARIYLAEALYSEHKYADAIREATEVYPGLAKRLGEDHQLTLQILATRAAAEGSLRQWEAAIRDDLAVYSRSMHKGGPEAFNSIGSLSDAGISQCKLGRYAEGEANTRKALFESIKLYGPRSALAGGVSYALATCLAGRNKVNEASELLNNIDIKAVTQFAGDPAVPADIDLLKGRISFKRGDYKAALAFATAAAPMLDRADADPDDHQSLVKLQHDIQSRLPAQR